MGATNRPGTSGSESPHSVKTQCSRQQPVSVGMGREGSQVCGQKDVKGGACNITLSLEQTGQFNTLSSRVGLTAMDV